MKELINAVIAAMILTLSSASAMQTKEQEVVPAIELYHLEDFEDMEYQILCISGVSDGPSNLVYSSAMVGGVVPDIPLPENMYVTYISPDGNWVITEEPYGDDGHEGFRRQSLYHDKRMLEQKVSTYSYPEPFIVVEGEEGYEEMPLYEEYESLCDKAYDKKYYTKFELNEYGTLAAGIYDFERIDILDIATQEVLWSIALSELGEYGDYGEIYQFMGTRESASLLVGVLDTTYQIDIPSGQVTVLGNNMYHAMYSPDRKYIVYSSATWDDMVGLRETDRQYIMLRGIYVRETATGRTAYVRENISEYHLEKRRFCWVEREETDSAAEPVSAETAAGIQADEFGILPYLAYDWTDDEVLMRHHIEPQDSAQGWDFYLADIDFDGSMEMLIAFPANHSGTNSLYIYGQQKGEVQLYGETIATSKENVISYYDYRSISPYMDIDLLDVYVKDGEYKYLSLDCSSISCQHTLTLYEYTLIPGTEPRKLIEMTRPIFEEMSDYEEFEKMYFLGEQVDGIDTLAKMLAEYMEGYTKMEMDVRDLYVYFPRDIVGLSEREKRQQLEILYQSLRWEAKLNDF